MDGRQEERQGEKVLGPRLILPHELQDLHRKLRGSLLQLEAIMRRLDVTFKTS
jgi:hypothetical protein